jgi:hypothetical protein
VIADTLAIVSTVSTENIDHESKANDCSATPRALSIVVFKSEGADCQGKTISKEEPYP